MRIVLIAAQSLDGFITKHDSPGVDFTSQEDKAWFPACLRKFDCCIMGGATYRQAREHILGDLNYSERRRIVLTRSPEKFAKDVRPGKIEFSSEEPRKLVERLRSEGALECALLGGGEIYGMFLAAGCVDEVWITLEPQIFGEGRPIAAARVDTRLQLKEITRLGLDVLLLKYRVVQGGVSRR